MQAVLFFRPDGEKKAYVRLAPDYDALDVANKVRPGCFCLLSPCNVFEATTVGSREPVTWTGVKDGLACRTRSFPAVAAVRSHIVNLECESDELFNPTLINASDEHRI